MCGIIYRKSLTKDNISQDILNMYKNQRHRGSEGFGFYLPNKNKIKHETDEKQIVKRLKNTNTTEMLFHHRYPTSTDNVLNACHPFKVTIDNKSYVVVHNGYLYNEHQLKADHEKLGYKYSSVQPDGRFNDSEALAYDLALYLSGKQRKLKSEGAIAFIVYQDDKVYFGRNTQSPLKYHQTDKFITIRSEGKGSDVKPDTLYRLQNGKLTESKLVVPEYNYKPTNPFGFSNYTDYDTQEDLESYDTWRETEREYERLMILQEIKTIKTEIFATDPKDISRIADLEWYLDELEAELKIWSK